MSTLENPDGEYAGLADDDVGVLGRGSGSPVVGQAIAGSDDHRLELAAHRLEVDHGLDSLELGHTLSSYDDAESEAGELDPEELDPEELDPEELAAGEPKDEVKEPDGDGEEPDGDELGDEVEELAEDVKELDGLTGLSFLAGLSSMTSGASVVRVLASVGEADATGASTGRSLMISARRAFTASDSVASGRLTLVPLAWADDLGLADAADLELVAVAPEEEAEAALVDPAVVTTAFGLVVADADVARP